MGVVTISNVCLVPVGADLTLEATNLEILRGLENAQRIDLPVASGVALVAGQWGVLSNSDNAVHMPGASSVPCTYLVFCGTDRFDSYATGHVTVFMGSNLLIKTSQFVAGSYSVGDDLTVVSGGTGLANLSGAGTGAWVVARVVTVGTGYLVVETVATPFKKPA